VPAYTLAQLRDQVAYAADVTVQTTGRYPVAIVNTWIQRAVEGYANKRALIRPSADARALLTSSSDATNTVHTFPLNELLQLPTDFLALRSVWLVDGSSRRQLQLLEETDRWQVDQVYGTGTPDRCRVTALPDGTRGLRLWPPANASYLFEVIYQPGAPILSADSDSWVFDPGCDDIVICPVALKMLARDGFPEPAVRQDLENRFALAVDELKKLLGRVDTNGVPRMRDTRGQRLNSNRKFSASSAGSGYFTFDLGPGFDSGFWA
jgi:hypothetical protein